MYWYRISVVLISYQFRTGILSFVPVFEEARREQRPNGDPEVFVEEISIRSNCGKRKKNGKTKRYYYYITLAKYIRVGKNSICVQSALDIFFGLQYRNLPLKYPDS